MAACACIVAGCSKHSADEGVKNLLSMPSPGLVVPSGGVVAYVDIDKIVAAHPLHGKLQALQDQITALNAGVLTGPPVTTAAQRAAQAALQRDLQNAEQQFAQEISRKRGYYEQQESAALARIQSQAISGGGTSGGAVVSGMQQEYGNQVKQMQAQGASALSAYRSTLFKQDTDHLHQVQRVISQDVAAKLRAREAQQSANETRYQISLATQNQEQRLNLKTRLENINLTPQERSQSASQLQDLDTREQYLINQLKATDRANLKAYEKQLNRDAAARFDAERARTEKETSDKLLARQKQMEDQMRGQVAALGGQFQQQLSAANKSLSADPKLQSRMEQIHTQMQSRYVADANQALAAYKQTRQALVAKYSAIAHLQFEDNQAVAAQIDQLAGARRDLYNRVVEQVQAQVREVARQQGVAVVFDSVAGVGTAIDLTAAVIQRIGGATTGSPAPVASGGNG